MGRVFTIPGLVRKQHEKYHLSHVQPHLVFILQGGWFYSIMRDSRSRTDGEVLQFGFDHTAIAHLAASRALATMHNLPEELVERIFLGFTITYPDEDRRADSQTLSNVCLVSRSWNRMATPLLYRQLKLWFDENSEETNVIHLLNTLKVRPDLPSHAKSLSIRYVIERQEGTKRLWSITDQQSVFDILHCCSNLKHIVLSDESYDGKLMKTVLFSGQNSLMRGMTLDLTMNGRSARNSGLERIVEPPHIQTLRIFRCSIPDRDFTTMIWLSEFSILKHLHLTGISKKDQGLYLLSSACRSLSSLYLKFQERKPVTREHYGKLLKSFWKHLDGDALVSLDVTQKGKRAIRNDCTSYIHRMSTFEHLRSLGLHGKLETIRMDVICLFNESYETELEHLPISLRHLTLCGRNDLFWAREGIIKHRKYSVVSQLTQNVQRTGQDFRNTLPWLESITLEFEITNTTTAAQLRDLLQTHGVRLQCRYILSYRIDQDYAESNSSRLARPLERELIGEAAVAKGSESSEPHCFKRDYSRQFKRPAAGDDQDSLATLFAAASIRPRSDSIRRVNGLLTPRESEIKGGLRDRN